MSSISETSTNGILHEHISRNIRRLSLTGKLNNVLGLADGSASAISSLSANSLSDRRFHRLVGASLSANSRKDGRVRPVAWER